MWLNTCLVPLMGKSKSILLSPSSCLGSTGMTIPSWYIQVLVCAPILSGSKDWVCSSSAGSEQVACTRLSFCLVLLECLPNTLLVYSLGTMVLAVFQGPRPSWFNGCFVFSETKVSGS